MTASPSSRIPRIIHQTAPTRDLPPALAQNVARLKADNPGWRHILWVDDDFQAFILQHYGPEMFAVFEKIDDDYGAAKSDFFRYLVIYVEGGIYLDLKSNAARPLDDIVRDDDEFILSQWDNEPDQDNAGFGRFRDLPDMEAGEFQQWHIVSTPRHPFIKAVIDRVVENLTRYDVWQFGTGQFGVLRVTGPIAYTLAIAPLRDRHHHRYVRDHTQLGLIYNALTVDHRSLYAQHYSKSKRPLVKSRGLRSLSDYAYMLAKELKARLRSALVGASDATRGDRRRNDQAV